MPIKGFLPQFLSLAILSGATLGMSKLVTTLYAMELGASSSQIGLIHAAEALGMVLLTLPAGVLIDRLGSGRLYWLASLLPAALHVAILCWSNWLWLLALRLLVGVCVPFRSVAMSTLFLQRLPTLGLDKAGWFRAALMAGMLWVGPWLGAGLYQHIGSPAMLAVALCFVAMALWGGHLWRQQQDQEPEQAPAAEDQPSQPRRPLAALRAVWRHATVRSCCLAEWLSSSTGSLVATFSLVLCVEQLHWTPTEAVQLITGQGLVTVLFLFGLSRHVRNIAAPRVYGLALLAACSALCLLGTASTFASLASAMLLLSAAGSSVHLANLGRLSAVTLDKGGVSGVFSLSQTLGMLCGSLYGGLLAGWLTLRQLFPVSAAMLLATAALVWLATRRSARSKS